MAKPALKDLTSRCPIYKGTVKKAARRYRDKIRINEEALREAYIQDPRLELGRWRHSNNFVNYDLIVEKINEKYREENPALAQEIIHSTSNFVNDKILVCIVETERWLAIQKPRIKT